MDVMADHDIHVTFHLEPYSQDRVSRFRTTRCISCGSTVNGGGGTGFFFHERDDGSQGPVFKLFRTTLPQRLEDCHGVVRALPDYVPDREWRRETDRLRQTVVGAFDT